jgi:drug/metabolite transporter (DMT)-like permease
MALTPIFVIPLVRIVFHERVSIRAVLGTLVAMVGVAMIFML